MLGFLTNLLNRGRRKLDILILWPVICEKAPTQMEAKRAMLLHMRMDPAWADYTTMEMVEVIESLPYDS